MHATFTPHDARASAADTERLHHIDQRLTDIRRDLSRASVMLAVGKLRPEGYVAFTEPLKQERARLEVERIGLLPLRG